MRVEHISGGNGRFAFVVAAAPFPLCPGRLSRKRGPKGGERAEKGSNRAETPNGDFTFALTEERKRMK